MQVENKASNVNLEDQNEPSPQKVMSLVNDSRLMEHQNFKVPNNKAFFEEHNRNKPHTCRRIPAQTRTASERWLAFQRDATRGRGKSK